MANDKKRLSVPLSSDFYNRLEAIAKYHGNSMATVASFWLSQKINEFEEQQKLMSSENMSDLIKQLAIKTEKEK